MLRYLIASLIAPIAAVPAMLATGLIDFWLMEESTFQDYVFSTLYISMFVLVIIYPISLTLMNLIAYWIVKYSEFTYRMAFIYGLIASSLLGITTIQSAPLLFIRIVIVGTVVTMCYWYVWSRLSPKI